MTRKLTQEEFVTKAKAVHGDTYDYSKAMYINAKTKVCVIDKEIGEFWVTPDKHLYSGQGPMKTAHKRGGQARAISFSDFIQKANSKYGSCYDYSLVNFKTLKDKVKIICKIHGEFEQVANKHLCRGGCRLCGIKIRGDKRRTKFNEFLVRAITIHKDKYIYNEDTYIKVSDYTTITCKKHGDFQQVGTCHLDGDGCPKCKSSRGEVKIENFLIRNKIKYKSQFKVNEKTRHRFDFYLPERNLLIEYDGEQHFKSIDFWGGDENLKKIQKNDKLKNKMAEDNNFKLLRIDYKNFNNIEKILEKEVYNGD